MQPTSFALFTTCVVFLWLFCLVWAWRQRPYYAFLLLTMAAYCFISEYLAIRLGKYFYGPFKLTVCVSLWQGPLPFPLSLLSFHTAGALCQAPDLCIPVAVFAMESVLFITILRTTDRLAPPEYVRPFLNALMMVNLDLLIDPVAANNLWCSTGSGPVFDGLRFWTWLTARTHVGYWWGVPLLNFTTWWSSVFAFTVVVRLIRRRLPMKDAANTSRIVRADLLGALAVLAIFLLAEFVLIFVMEAILNLSYSLAWQGSVVAVLLGISFLVVLPWVRRFQRAQPFDWFPVVAQLFFFFFFLGALIVGRYPGKEGVFAVWLVTFVLGAVFILNPYWKRSARAAP